MGFFDVSFDDLIQMDTPTQLRDPLLTALMVAYIAPIKYNYELFMANRNGNLYLLNHSSQVCYMEAVLNDVFDMTERRITITDGTYLDPLYVFKNAEERPLFLNATLYTSAEIASAAGGFVVNVPTAVATAAGYDVNRLRALIKLYRLAGKTTYTINIF